jgi:uncharacterized membrane protein
MSTSIFAFLSFSAVLSSLQLAPASRLLIDDRLVASRMLPDCLPHLTGGILQIPEVSVGRHPSSVLTTCAAIVFFVCFLGICSAQAPPAQPPKKPMVGPPSPQSTHYPILLLAFGNDPSWSLRIGQKGPERLDRPGYPPIPLDAAEVTHEAADSWIYHAKDSATGAAVAVHLARESCSVAVAASSSASPAEAVTASPSAPPSPAAKYSFTASVDHAQLGTLQGCGRIAAELFPKINNQPDEDEDSDVKKPPVPTITNFKPPAAVAYLNSAGNIVLSRGGVKKIAAQTGTELALSHDGKKLLYTRLDSKTGPDCTIVLYDFDSGKSQDLVHGLVRQAFWSPDDSRIALLKAQDHDWQVWSFPSTTPDAAISFSSQPVTSLHGWLDVHTLLATDMQNAYWISEEKPLQTVPLKELYGEAFQIMSSDTIRANPLNSDLLLFSADYSSAPAGAPKDAVGLTAGFFLYEVRSKRRVPLCPLDQWGHAAEWSRDGLQVFYTRLVRPNVTSTFRIFWDGTGMQKYAAGTGLVVGQ